MNIKNLTELMKSANVEFEGEVSENVTFSELEIDSLDIMMLSFEIEKKTGKKLTFTKDETMKEVMEKING